jgi:penicillin amidase
MNGLAGPQTVSGADGVGKVHIKFRPRKKKRFPFGFSIFISCIMMIFLSYCWGRDDTRTNYILPVLRKILSSIDNIYLRKENENYSLIGLNDNVNISRDKFGVAYIDGKSFNDVIYAQGFMHATDRFFQMDLIRRTAMGRLSELIGEKGYESDVTFRSLILLDLAEGDFNSLGSKDKSLLKSYCDGINSYLDIHSINYLPKEYYVSGINKEDILLWDPIHTLLLIRLFALENSHGWEDSFSEYLASINIPLLNNLNINKNTIEEKLYDSSRVVDSIGGSSFILSGKNTISGKPLMGVNFHSKLKYGNDWYFNSLYCPELNVTGASRPGIPLIFIGHNEYISWGMTASDVDTEKIHINVDIPINNCLNDDHRNTCDNNIKSRQEVILIKGKTEKNISIFSLGDKIEISNTIHSKVKSFANIQNNSDGQRVVPRFMLSSKILNSRINLQFLFNLNNATNWEEFNLSIRDNMNFMPFHFTYSDKLGNIGVLSSLDKSNFILNPTQELFVIDDSRTILDENYLRFILLNQNNRQDENKLSKLSIDSIKKVFSDTFSLSSLFFVNSILSIKDEFPTNENTNIIKICKDIVRGFDGFYTDTSIPPVLIEIFKIELRDLILRNYGIAYLSSLFSGGNISPLNKVRESSYGSDMKWLMNVLTSDDEIFNDKSGSKQKLLLNALLSAYKKCIKRFGKNPSLWKWGLSHSVQVNNPVMIHQVIQATFGQGPVIVGGGPDSLFRTCYNSNNFFSNDKNNLLTSNSMISSLRYV